MLHLVGYIWICLLAAFSLGLLISYLGNLRRLQRDLPQEENLIQSQVTPQELAELREELALTRSNLDAIRGELMATKSDLMATKAERDLARAEFTPLLAEIEALREVTIAQEKAIADTQEHVRLYADALHQANANIRTANLTIQAAQDYLQSQTAEIEHLKTELQNQPELIKSLNSVGS